MYAQLRIIAMTKAGKMAAVIAKIAAAATQSLVVPAYFLFLCVIMYSSAMFYLEKGEYVSCEGMSREWAAGLTNTALLGDLPPKPELEHHFCEGGLRKTDAWDAECAHHLQLVCSCLQMRVTCVAAAESTTTKYFLRLKRLTIVIRTKSIAVSAYPTATTWT